MSEENKTQSVLIFEDDIDLAFQWTNYLKKRGMDVHHAMNVDEAVNFCAQIKFDFVILDMFLADADGNLIPRGGITMLTYLRNTPLKKVPAWGATVPIIVVTGANPKRGFDPLSNAKAVGGTRSTLFLRKPFKPEVLYSKIQRLMERREIT